MLSTSKWQDDLKRQLGTSAMANKTVPKSLADAGFPVPADEFTSLEQGSGPTILLSRAGAVS